MGDRLRTIAIANQKGGVGKTVTVQNLAVALALLDQRVLVVDVDPQANLSLNSGIDLHSQKLSTFDVLVNNRGIAEVIRLSDQGYDIAPSKPILARAEGEMKGKPGWVRRLRTALAPIDAHYDYCLIDTPPTIVFLAVNALVASNAGVIIPFLPAPNAIAGMQLVMARMDELRPENDTLRVVACVPNRLERWRVEWKLLEQVKREYPALPFTEPIPKHADFVKAELYRVSVFDLAPRGAVAKAFLGLAQRLIGAEDRVAEIVGRKQDFEKVASWT